MLTGLTTADFNGATVEKFMRTVSATADYDFGNGMSYSGTNRNRINHSSRYGLGTDEMGNVVYVNGGRDGEGDGFFATGALRRLSPGCSQAEPRTSASTAPQPGIRRAPRTAC